MSAPLMQTVLQRLSTPWGLIRYSPFSVYESIPLLANTSLIGRGIDQPVMDLVQDNRGGRQNCPTRAMYFVPETGGRSLPTRRLPLGASS